MGGGYIPPAKQSKYKGLVGLIDKDGLRIRRHFSS